MSEKVKPHHLINSYLYACKRAHTDMRGIAEATDLPASTRQMARQAIALIAAIAVSIQPKDTN